MLATVSSLDEYEIFCPAGLFKEGNTFSSPILVLQVVVDQVISQMFLPTDRVKETLPASKPVVSAELAVMMADPAPRMVISPSGDTAATVSSLENQLTFNSLGLDRTGRSIIS